MQMIETTARSVEEAIELALRELDAERGEVEIDVVSRGKAGILGIGSKVRLRILRPMIVLQRHMVFSTMLLALAPVWNSYYPR